MDTQTKQENFRRLAERRTQAALDKIRLIGNLGGSQYASTEAQIRRIETALLEAVGDAVTRMQGTKSEREPFTLS